jgi:hypothetical protein
MESCALGIDASQVHFDIRYEFIDVRVHRLRQGDLNTTSWEGSQSGGRELLGRGLPPARAEGPPYPGYHRVRFRAVCVSVRNTQADSDDDGRELGIVWVPVYGRVSVRETRMETGKWNDR